VRIDEAPAVLRAAAPAWSAVPVTYGERCDGRASASCTAPGWSSRCARWLRSAWPPRTRLCAGLAQAVEQPPCKPQVRGSSPLSGLTQVLVITIVWRDLNHCSRVEVLRLRTMGDDGGTTRTMGEADDTGLADRDPQKCGQPPVSLGALANASGQPPCSAITSSISPITRIVSAIATAIFS